jgi:hypothetical protein
VVILPVIRHLTSQRDAIVSGLIAGPLAMAPAILFFAAMIAFYPGIMHETLPSDFMLRQLDMPAVPPVVPVHDLCRAARKRRGIGARHQRARRCGAAGARTCRARQARARGHRRGAARRMHVPRRPLRPRDADRQRLPLSLVGLPRGSMSCRC